MGDILTANTQAIVNTVNCVGVMGKGLALQFKTQYPENFEAYAKACKANRVVPGKLFVYPTGGLLDPQYIINFPTKRHWREKSRIQDIESGLIDLAIVIQQYDITSIALPPLGCGLGGLEWIDVEPLLAHYLRPLPNLHVVVYGPNEHSNTKPPYKENTSDGYR